jgi:hypothetical protein
MSRFAVAAQAAYCLSAFTAHFIPQLFARALLRLLFDDGLA